jgi:cellulose synthase/poly-beta-1,6-N-acetylglucosamine synthase-like glycosyltransferase
MTEQLAKPLLSIVATSYSMDRLEDIKHLLDSVKAQIYSQIEFVFVAERSPELFDKVKALADSIGITNTRVLVNTGKSGLSTSRNLGISQAQGEIVAIVDDDVVLFPDWAEQMVKTYLDSSIVGVTGPVFPMWEDESMNWFPDEFSWMWGGTLWCDWHKGDEIRKISNVGGMNCSFTREALKEVGGFLTLIGPLNGYQEKDEKLVWFRPGILGEEVELSLRVIQKTGKQIVFNPKVRVYHKVHRYRFSWGWIARRAYAFGYAKHMVKSLYPKWEGKPTLGKEYDVLRRIFIRLIPSIGKKLFSHPIIAWRQLLVTILGVFFTGLGYAFYIFKPLKLQVQKKG